MMFRFKKSFFGIILALFSAAFFCLPIETFSVPSNEIGIITANKLHVRTGPGKIIPHQKFC
jgi:hypothetical protein